jgi:hypothetical protein
MSSTMLDTKVVAHAYVMTKRTKDTSINMFAGGSDSFLALDCTHGLGLQRS